MDPTEFIHDSSLSLQACLRDAAAKHPDGDGPDVSCISSEMGKFPKNGEHGMWAPDLCAVSGGQWTGVR